LSTDIIQPNRNNPITKDGKYGNLRLHEFFDALVQLAADLPDQGAAVADATVTADGLNITWTTNEPTASTTQTIADGNNPTASETGQSIANLVAEVNKLKNDVTTNKNKINELLTSLEDGSIIAT
jgi:hypothetical protein